ncbi:MAG: hypothetical protein QM703_17795 [Gemmatales bacterium]
MQITKIRPLVIFILLYGNTTNSVHCDDSLATQIKSSVPEKWSKRISDISSIDIDATVIGDRFDSRVNKIVRSTTTVAKQKNGCKYLYENTWKDDGKSGGEVRCINEFSFFKLKLNNDKWVLLQMLDIAKAKANLTDLESPNGLTTNLLTSNLYCYTSRIYDLFKEDGFSISSTYGTIDNPEGVVVNFKSTNLSPNRPNISEGTITLLPKNDWTIKKYDVVCVFKAGKDLKKFRATGEYACTMLGQMD